MIDIDRGKISDKKLLIFHPHFFENKPAPQRYTTEKNFDCQVQFSEEEVSISGTCLTNSKYRLLVSGFSLDNLGRFADSPL